MAKILIKSVTCIYIHTFRNLVKSDSFVGVRVYTVHAGIVASIIAGDGIDCRKLANGLAVCAYDHVVTSYYIKALHGSKIPFTRGTLFCGGYCENGSK